MKEAIGSGQWPNVKKKMKSKKGKVILEKGKVTPEKGKVITEKGTVISEKGKVITEKSTKSASKFAPQTKFMRAKDLLRGLLRKNHAAKKDFRNVDGSKDELGKDELHAGSKIVSWTVKCDDCGHQAENITALATHKKASHLLKGEE